MWRVASWRCWSPLRPACYWYDTNGTPVWYVLSRPSSVTGNCKRLQSRTINGYNHFHIDPSFLPPKSQTWSYHQRVSGFTFLASAMYVNNRKNSIDQTFFLCDPWQYTEPNLTSYCSIINPDLWLISIPCGKRAQCCQCVSVTVIADSKVNVMSIV